MKKKLSQILSAIERGAQIAKIAAEETTLSQKAIDLFLSSRFSSEDDLETSYEAQVCKVRDDYPALKKRKTVMLANGKTKLAGYYYETKKAKGIVLYVHGLRGQADDMYALGEDYFLGHGYNVFALDLSSSGRSTGTGVDSLSRGAKDVALAARYVRANFRKLPLYLFGHSWGGYSVVASTHYFQDVAAVASISGFVSPVEEMLGLPSQKSGLPLGAAKEEVAEAVKNRCPEDFDLSAYDAIVENPDIPYFVAIGGQDRTVPLKKASLYGALELKPTKNAELHFEPQKGHMDILLSDEAGRKRASYIEYSKAYAKENGKNFAKLSMEKKKEYFEFVKKEESSVPNKELFEAVLDFFSRGGVIDFLR